MIGSAYPSAEKFQSVSRFVLRDFTCDESRACGYHRTRPEGSVFAGISMYALGGRVSEIGIDDTAFFYRNANYIVWLETVWEEHRYAEDNKDWIINEVSYLNQ